MFKPEWDAKRGLACLRVGGLSPVIQNNSKAPTSKGLWAFVFPYFDWWYVSGKMSQDKFPKKETPKHLMPKPRKFFVQGVIYTRLNVPGSEKIELWHSDAPVPRLEVWYETTTKELFKFLPKQFSKDIAWLRSDKRMGELADVIKHPYFRGKGGYMGVDHLEVFVPASSKVL